MGLIKAGLRKKRGGKRAVISALPVVALVFIIVAIYIIYTKENIALGFALSVVKDTIPSKY